MQRQLFKRAVILGALGILGSAVISNTALASGFQLFEADGAGVGDFYAGGAAEADTASTAYFNPAGMVRLKHPELVISGVGIFSRSEFTGTSIWSTTNPRISPLGPYPQSGKAEGGTDKVAPGLDFVMPLNDEFTVGFSVAAPFGLSSDYDNQSFVRYAATKSAVQVLDLSPVIAFKITNNLSLGFGPDFDRVDATLDSFAGLPSYGQHAGFGPTAYDTKSENTASGWGMGWHAGMLYQFTPCTRVGLSYHSKVSVGVTGSSLFKGPLAGGPGTLNGPIFNEFFNEDLRADTTLPASSMLSVFHQVNNAWAVMGTAAYTQWNVFDNLTLQNVEGANSSLQPIMQNVSLPQNFKNTWRFAAGVSYQPVQNWKFRAGLGWDQNPTNDKDRNIRLPDANRTALSVGAHYQATKTFAIDGGFTHLFFQDAPIRITQTAGSQVVSLAGKSETYANLVGLQLTWDFV